MQQFRALGCQAVGYMFNILFTDIPQSGNTWMEFNCFLCVKTGIL